jgi:predicted nucleic acid-binding protein
LVISLRHGIQRLDDSRRRRRLDAWLRDEFAVRFEGRIIPIDLPVADTWGDLVARREAAGRPIGVMEAFIAETANVHALALVTRNVSDFESAVGDIVNPWL